jgi:hypothetical protein
MTSAEGTHMLAAQKPKKRSEQRLSKSHQKDIEALTKAQIEAIRSMESQKSAGKMVSSLLSF